MVKFICDKCKKEVPRVTRVLEEQWAKDGHGAKLMPFIVAAHDLCDKCNERFKRLDLDIADYIKLSEEELKLLEYTFSVGDTVITSTGKIGVITDICTCERCKARGFYEPRVEAICGNGAIYITDTDKENGFSNFYQIGKHKFGNLDEQSLIQSIDLTNKTIKDAQHELEVYHQQLDNIALLIVKQTEGDNA